MGPIDGLIHFEEEDQDRSQTLASPWGKALRSRVWCRKVIDTLDSIYPGPVYHNFIGLWRRRAVINRGRGRIEHSRLYVVHIFLRGSSLVFV